MKESKITRRALLGSVISIVLCTAMLVGATFAWFTDTASTKVNQVKSGTLKVSIVNEADQNIENTPLTWQKADGHTEEDVLWEPGATYKTTGFKVQSDGTLALKYKLSINGITGDSELLKAITFSVVDANGQAVALDTYEGHLTATDKQSGVLYIQGHMDEAAGNDYQDKALDSLSITVVATQDTVEYDSSTDQYDATATYPVASVEDVQKALTEGGVFNLTEDIDPATAMVATSDVTLDATGQTIANTADVWDANLNFWSLISAQENANLTITGGTFQAKTDDCYAVDVQDGATVTIKDGTYTGNIHAVYVQQGTAYIEGGFYSIQQLYPDANKAYGFVLNCYDANRANGTAKIIVTGGTFVNFNPADCWAEGEHTNFVADGYKVVSEKQSNGDVWYTVVPQQ